MLTRCRSGSTISAPKTNSKDVSMMHRTSRGSSAVSIPSGSRGGVDWLVVDRFGYDPSDIVLLTDSANDDRSYPTRENMIKAMQWLVEGAERDDSLFFH